MACGCIEPCSCEGADTKPSKLGVEDLTLGCGTETQIRGCQKLEITQINSKHITFCQSGKPVEYYLEELRRMFPYIECGLTVPTLNIGNWDDATVTSGVDSCAIGLPDEVVQRIPAMEGDVSRHNGCLWISLVNDNMLEPSESSQNSKDWLCLSNIDSRFDILEACCEDIGTRVTTLEACCDILSNPEDTFISDTSGVIIKFWDDPSTLDAVTLANSQHYTDPYPDSSTGITAQSGIDSGLAPIDPLDSTATQWFALTLANNIPVNNTPIMLQGEFNSPEPGFHETPLAYTDNVSRTTIELVALHHYIPSNAQYPDTPGATNPYSTVHEYVVSRIQSLVPIISPNEAIQTIPAVDGWTSVLRDHALRVRNLPRNEWQDSASSQYCMIFARFKNRSASSSTLNYTNNDNPSYTPGNMTPQPIAQYNQAKISRVSGIYKYRKLLGEPQ